MVAETMYFCSDCSGFLPSSDCLATSEWQHNSKQPAQKKRLICSSSYASHTDDHIASVSHT